MLKFCEFGDGDAGLRKPQISPLRYPEFPVEFGDVGDLPAAFLNESRTRGYVQRCVAGNPGSLRSR
jgi:hypothetical protein